MEATNISEAQVLKSQYSNPKSKRYGSIKVNEETKNVQPIPVYNQDSSQAIEEIELTPTSHPEYNQGIVGDYSNSTSIFDVNPEISEVQEVPIEVSEKDVVDQLLENGKIYTNKNDAQNQTNAVNVKKEYWDQGDWEISPEGLVYEIQPDGSKVAMGWANVDEVKTIRDSLSTPIEETTPGSHPEFNQGIVGEPTQSQPASHPEYNQGIVGNTTVNETPSNNATTASGVENTSINPEGIGITGANTDVNIQSSSSNAGAGNSLY